LQTHPILVISVYFFQSIFPRLSIEAACSTTEPICLGEGDEEGLFCALPVVSGSLDITALLAGASDAISFDVCFTETAILGFPLDSLGLPLCVSAAQSIFGDLSGQEEDLEADAAQNSCVATLGGATCNSCFLCRRNSKGMVFDCSNIDPEIVSSTCTSSFPQSFADISKPDAISMPELDGLRR